MPRSPQGTQHGALCQAEGTRGSQLQRPANLTAPSTPLSPGLGQTDPVDVTVTGLLGDFGKVSLLKTAEAA